MPSVEGGGMEINMNIEDAIFGRRSIRRFDEEKKVPQEIIDKIIEAGIHAPSACNFQAWKMIVIDDEETIKKLLEVGCSSVISKSRQGIVVVYRNDLFVTGYKHKDYIQSASAAIENMLLMAYSLGIATCWLCDLPSGNVLRHILEIPENFDIIAYIAFGYPTTGKSSSKSEMEYHYGTEKKFEAHERKYSLEQVICPNRFKSVDGDITTFSLKNNKKTVVERIKRKANILLHNVMMHRK